MAGGWAAKRTSEERGFTREACPVANKFAPQCAGCFVAGLHETLVAVFYSHVERKPGRRRDRLAQAARAGGPRPQARRRPLHLSPARAARDAENLADLPRGTRRRRRHRAVDAARASDGNMGKW